MNATVAVRIAPLHRLLLLTLIVTDSRIAAIQSVASDAPHMRVPSHRADLVVSTGHALIGIV
ncbi:MAG: hypothetical protein DMD81_07875 [Candidatus Rokuibacteriota bacterium]|nr:MAG: hypothetical protein DMD81_07875 [Candidatus Rokubacteria bacterium]